MKIRRSRAFSLLALAAFFCPHDSEAADKYNSTPPARTTYNSTPPARSAYNSSANQPRSYSTGTQRMNTFNNRSVVAPRQTITSPRPGNTPRSSLTATQKARVNNITNKGINQGVMTSRLSSAGTAKPTIDKEHVNAMNSRLSSLNSRLNAKPDLGKGKLTVKPNNATPVKAHLAAIDLKAKQKKVASPVFNAQVKRDAPPGGSEQTGNGSNGSPVRGGAHSTNQTHNLRTETPHQ